MLRVGGRCILLNSRDDSSPSVRLLLILYAVYVVWPSNAAAQSTPYPGPLPFPPEQLEPILNPANGHYYQIVHRRYERPHISLNPSFQFALNNAESRTHLGIRGHLVTITSQGEHDFLFDTFGNPYLGDWLWIGASDAAVEGEWRWVSGPEAGELFWLGNVDGTVFGFESWGFNRDPLPHDEPNNFNDNQPLVGEDFAAMQIFGPEDPSSFLSTVWNDIADPSNWFSYRPEGFIVEYSPIPEPSASAIAATCVVGLSCVRRRNRPLPAPA
jgi:hypothetical protein